MGATLSICTGAPQPQHSPPPLILGPEYDSLRETPPHCVEERRSRMLASNPSFTRDPRISPSYQPPVNLIHSSVKCAANSSASFTGLRCGLSQTGRVTRCTSAGSLASSWELLGIPTASADGMDGAYRLHRRERGHSFRMGWGQGPDSARLLGAGA